MTRKMNKPDWELARYKCGYNRCPIYYNTAFIDCNKCNNIKPKQRVLNPDIKEFFERCCNMERLK